jgi:hypothetical protein
MSPEAAIVGPRPKVFLSHSAHEASARAVLDVLERELRDAGFEVLVDFTRLAGGDNWRKAISDWMAICHAAVAILDPVALDSTWVQHELSALSFRRSVDDRIKLLPVLMGGVSEEDLKTRKWDPQDLAEIQGVKADQPAEVAARVKESLDGIRVRYSSESPIHGLEQDIRGLLRDVNPDALTTAAGRLGLDLSRWTIDSSEKAVGLARKLLESSLGQIYHAMAELRTAWPKPAADVFELAAPFAWVKWDAARAIRHALHEDPRYVGLNTSDFRTCKMYVKRAQHRLDVMEVPLVGHEHAADDLRAGILAALSDYGFDDWKVADINAHLAEEPVVLVAPIPPPDKAMLLQATEDLTNLNLFFRAGARGRPVLVEAGIDEAVRYLEPELLPDDEESALRLYELYKKKLKRGDRE